MNLPNFSFEKALWKKGYKFVAGLDEVGRGCFAGPVVAGCVVFDRNSKFQILNSKIEINDSKKLKPRQREKGANWIKTNALSWGIGEVPATLINRIGMGKATKVAFRRAISDARRRLGDSIDYLLIDAFYIPFVKGLPVGRKNPASPAGRQKPIIHGDEKSYSIAAASMIAKVYRDKLMQKLSRRHRVYGWGRNKGYGTAEHQRAIKKYGLTRYHRKVFVETFLNNFSSSQAR